VIKMLYKPVGMLVSLVAAAINVLRTDPGTDTVHALGNLAHLEASAGSPDADRLSAEALIFGQALGAGDAELSRLLAARGTYLAGADRHTEAAAYFRESARLASQAGDSMPLGNALSGLADILAGTDPGAAAETARTAAGHLRRVGDRDGLPYATTNLAQALLMLGDWDDAEAELTRSADSNGLADREYLACYGAGWRRCAVMPPPPKPCWRASRSCVPAKTPRKSR